MGRTVYDQALRHQLKERMGDLEWVGILVDTLAKLNNGFWGAQYVDFFVQKGGWMNREYTLDDAFPFAMLHAALCGGSILVCDLCIGRQPYPDAQVQENLNALTDGLRGLTCPGVPEPTFEANIWGGTQGEDGYLKWSPYLEFACLEDGQESQKVWVSECSIPLEIGSQSAVKTYMQILDSGGVARWPYGSDTLRIFYKTVER